MSVKINFECKVSTLFVLAGIGTITVAALTGLFIQNYIWHESDSAHKKAIKVLVTLGVVGASLYGIIFAVADKIISRIDIKISPH